MIKRCDKRGQGLSTSAIILIVLGVFILAIMIIGFMVGWNRIAPWLSNENVDNIVNSCVTACTTGSVYGYCSKPMNLNDGEDEYSATCYAMSIGDEFSVYGIDSCSDLDCNVEVSVDSLNYTMNEEDSVQIKINGNAPVEGIHYKASSTQ
ncbi:MAG: hypothetical protein OQK82_00370 [Candidatus Pacearchaeota archaeon]|nr:hypothetical protein [Candidatus Pacearchaeota archaeon]